MDDNFNIQELLSKITKQIMADAPDITEEQADKEARRFIEHIVKAGSGGDGCIIGIGNQIITMGDGSRETSADPLPQTAEEMKVEISLETQEKVDKVLAKVDEKIPPVETVRLKLSRGETTVFDSKMGGVPYFPKGMKYPTVRGGKHAGKPLYFIAQLNFGTLPRIEGFPTEGILQFFAGFDNDEDYTLGSGDDVCCQNGFRVIYHEKIINDGLFASSDMPEFEELDPMCPVNGELLLTADEPERVSVTSCDCRFEDAFVAAYNKVCGTSFESIWGKGGLYDANADFCNAVFEARNLQGTRIGGYPFFMQGDPRGHYPDHSVLLFQSDSEWETEDYCVCWGDVGAAKFFITPGDLARRDFSNVLYNWDCG